MLTSTAENREHETWNSNNDDCLVTTSVTISACSEGRSRTTSTLIGMAQLTLEEAKQLACSSWEQAEQFSKEELGIIMFRRLYEIDPAVQDLFWFARGMSWDQIVVEPAFKKHIVKVLDTVGFAVSMLDDLDELEPILVKLGTKHAKYKVKKQHIPAVGEALIFTFEQKLQSQFGPLHRQAWEMIYALIGKAISQGLEQQ